MPSVHSIHAASGGREAGAAPRSAHSTLPGVPRSFAGLGGVNCPVCGQPLEGGGSHACAGRPAPRP